MLKYVIQISDLHIRSGTARYNEYDDVFNKTVTSIQNTTCDMLPGEFIIIVTGDIFHRDTIDCYGMTLFTNLIGKLAKLCKIYIINSKYESKLHDDNITIINKPTSFVLDDVGFSYVDDLTTDVPSVDGFVKLVSFHGIVDGNNLNRFKYYDFGLMSGNGKMQYAIYNKKFMYGYAGSLIQQSVNQDIMDSGYLIWNLRDGDQMPIMIKIHNDYGKIIALPSQDGNDVLIKYRNKTIRLEQLTACDNFPKILEIRTIGCINLDILSKILSNGTYTLFTAGENTKRPSFNVREDLLSYLVSKLDVDEYELIKTILNTSKLELIHSKESIELSSDDSNGDTDDVKFRICNLEWANLYCYDTKKYVNFESYGGKICSLIGKNGSGKSALFDILLLSLWGKIPPSKKCVGLSGGCINRNKTTAYTTVTIFADRKYYKLHRTFTLRGDCINPYHTSLSVTDETTSETVEHIGSSCKSVLLKVIGKLEEFLASCMITQYNDVNPTEYKNFIKLIDKTYDTDKLDDIHKLLDTTLRKYADYDTILRSKIINDLPSNDSIDVNELLTKRCEIQNYLSTLHVDKNDTLTDDEYTSVIFRYNTLKKRFGDKIIEKPCDENTLEYEKQLLVDESIDHPTHDITDHFKNCRRTRPTSSVTELQMELNTRKTKLESLIREKPDCRHAKSSCSIDENVLENHLSVEELKDKLNELKSERNRLKRCDIHELAKLDESITSLVTNKNSEFVKFILNQVDLSKLVHNISIKREQMKRYDKITEKLKIKTERLKYTKLRISINESETYNLKCECCIRRIEELNRFKHDINKLETKIINLQKLLPLIDYNEYELDIKTLSQYYIYEKWYFHYLYDEIDNTIKDIKNTLKYREIYESIEKYKLWELEYTTLNTEISEITKLIDCIKYESNTKQSYERFNNLKSKYTEWLSYDEYKKLENKIKNTHNSKELQIKLTELNEINERIEECKINEFRRANIIQASKTHVQIVNEIDKILNIIRHLESYKYHLYDNIILPKYVETVNKELLDMIHPDNIQIKLSYKLSPNNISYIDWLINDDSNNKRCISLNQASGFHKIAITTAMRLCISSKCIQLFVDESFDNLDPLNSLNISTYLKQLMHRFLTIFLISHDTKIIDSTDECITVNNI